MLNFLDNHNMASKFADLSEEYIPSSSWTPSRDELEEFPRSKNFRNMIGNI